MKLNKLNIKNFRGYKLLELDFDPSFNLIIGDNGSGKTALLEAVAVAIGSFFLGIRDIESPTIRKNDIHIATHKNNEEYLFPVEIEATGEINKKKIDWTRKLNGIKNKTLASGAEKIKKIAEFIDNQVRQGEKIDLPILLYYATGRLFDKENGKNKITIASRFRAYEKCLDAKSNYQQFQEWFRGKELSRIQKGSVDISFEVVKKVIIKNLPDCKNVYYEFDVDKPKGLKIELSDGRILPFQMLSDGTRNFFAIISDIAYKCITLNPHLKERALTKTAGIILIDELDLHLHPEWQRKIIFALRTTFPAIQFIATTHSPFLIQETGKEQLIILDNSKVKTKGSGNNLSIEDIAEELQDVRNPQWSKSRQKMFKVAAEYYKAVKEGIDTKKMKNELDKVMKPFALDTAFYAILEQVKQTEQEL